MAMTDSFGLYIHVPFCATRCGYCDFNTSTPGELGSPQDLTGPYLDALERELDKAAEKINRPADTIFVGGGTPSLLGGAGLTRVLNAARNSFGISPDAEITTESNPESTSPEFFEQIKEAGFTRVSLGMQSAASHVLQILERAHTPGRPFAAAREAKAAGFEHVNLDMIYATPTETDDDVRRTLVLALETGVDHISAYSLSVEDGTRMARKVKKGELPAPDQDTMAKRYEIIASRLDDAGFGWYEVSNWAKEGGGCRHNMIYWRDQEWCGAGPGAHSHIGNERCYNVKLPGRYIKRLGDHASPLAASAPLTRAAKHTEQLMWGLRLRDGIDRRWFLDAAPPMVDSFSDRGALVDDGRLRVTTPGRLLADGIITDLLLAD